ncbi:GtrA family protein [Pontiellaceae bacterium B12219]|nr:GtrA family protein [Pontiellaceae bacterium B12219]
MEKNHPGIQFFKYSLFGGFAFGADIITFFLMAWFFFPALTENDIPVKLFQLEIQPVSDSVRTINFVICSAVAFLVSNMTAYILNVLFVFKAGKHGFWKELGLFYLVSGVSIAIGTAVGALLITQFGLSTTFSYIAKAVAATLINYAGRKFFIFHG